MDDGGGGLTALPFHIGSDTATSAFLHTPSHSGEPITPFPASAIVLLRGFRVEGRKRQTVNTSG